MVFSFPKEHDGYTEVLVSRMENMPPILKVRAVRDSDRKYTALVRDGKTGRLLEQYWFRYETGEVALSRARTMATTILKDRGLLN
jgi:hypothetical protein